MDIFERVQQMTKKMIKGLEHLSKEKDERTGTVQLREENAQIEFYQAV